jgi:hypothetical protein
VKAAMSRGLGHIERAILDAIEKDKERDEPMPAHVNSWTMTCEVFQDGTWTFSPSIAHRKAVVRAMHSFVRKFPQYALTGGKGRKLLYLYEIDDPVSAAWARMSVARRGFVSLGEVRSVLGLS